MAISFNGTTLTFNDATTQTTASKLVNLGSSVVTNATTTTYVVPFVTASTYRYLYGSWIMRAASLAGNNSMSLGIASTNGGTINWTSSRNNAGTVSNGAFNFNFTTFASNFVTNGTALAEFAVTVEIFLNTTDVNTGSYPIIRLNVMALPSTLNSATNSDNWTMIGRAYNGQGVWPNGNGIGVYTYLNGSAFYLQGQAYGWLV